tara:strand:- start:5918 stop:6499 length:582 start_codon:yes stop_codon:yes gene_type:complete
MESIIKEAENILCNGGIGVLKTDTIYGVLGKAMSRKTVERVYKLRKRDTKKPFIILISNIKDLYSFGIKVDKKTRKILNNLWPGKVSIILNCPFKKFKYLHRGKDMLAFRIPKDKNLINLLKKTGPLIAPSANVSGMKPANTIKEAYEYFKDNIDFYVDSKKVISEPSTLIYIKDGNLSIKRQGASKIPKEFL